jgi:hypothetical protein
MRVHASSSDLFDRAAEIETFRGVSQAGLGPRLLLLFANGRVEEFLSQHVRAAGVCVQGLLLAAAADAWWLVDVRVLPRPACCQLGSAQLRTFSHCVRVVVGACAGASEPVVHARAMHVSCACACVSACVR